MAKAKKAEAAGADGKFTVFFIHVECRFFAQVNSIFPGIKVS